jgi:hypothetical protein
VNIPQMDTFIGVHIASMTSNCALVYTVRTGQNRTLTTIGQNSPEMRRGARVISIYPKGDVLSDRIALEAVICAEFDYRAANYVAITALV